MRIERVDLRRAAFTSACVTSVSANSWFRRARVTFASARRFVFANPLRAPPPRGRLRGALSVASSAARTCPSRDRHPLLDVHPTTFPVILGALSRAGVP